MVFVTGFVNWFWTVLGFAVGLLAIVLLSYVPLILLACWAAVRDAWADRKGRKAAEAEMNSRLGEGGR